MKHLSFQLFFAFIITLAANAQVSSDKTLLTIGNRQVTVGEFERIYQKNANISTAEKQSIQEYFDLFVKFKLKVSAALDAGLDTLSSFKKELKGYRDQLAHTYLTDQRAMDSLVREAYDRTYQELNISHIMILFPNTPETDVVQKKKDTLSVTAKIAGIKERLKAGESFEKLAAELSEDPSAKSNKGNLGWISAFRYPYGFENGAYNLKKGQVSDPVITKFGMHLIRLNDKRLSPGEVKVAHIMLAVPQNAPDSAWVATRLRAEKLYSKLKNGEDFAKMARENSDDQNSGKQGGELAWFGSGRMIAEFENAAFALKTNGDLSQPVRTVVGWHILKLLDKHPVGTFDQAKGDLKTKVSADEQRMHIVNNSFLQKLKKQYSYKIYNESVLPFLQLDSSVYKGSIVLSDAVLSHTMLSIQKTTFTGARFKSYLEANPIKNKKTGLSNYINESFRKFVENCFLAYEDDMLEKKYPDFSNLIGEYHDGILLFDIMDQQVWSKASADTVGLQAFYKNVWLTGKTEPQKLEDAKGLITADYQSYLEEKWIEELKNKYKVVIKQDLFDKIATKYKTTQ